MPTRATNLTSWQLTVIGALGIIVGLTAQIIRGEGWCLIPLGFVVLRMGLLRQET